MTRIGALTLVAALALAGCATSLRGQKVGPEPTEPPAATQPAVPMKTWTTAPGVLREAAPSSAPLAVAGQDGFWLSREEAARLFSRDQQVGLLERDVTSVKEELAIEKVKTASLRELVEIEREKATGRAEIARIEVERREAMEQRAKDAERKIKYNRVAAGAGAGAAAGSLGGPIGMAVGAVIGAGFGWFAGD